MNSILDQNLVLKGKKVILRVDLNVPMKNGSITEVSRIIKILPTLKLLVKKEAKIIILSHVGRPKGKIITSLSLKPICEDLKNKLNENVELITKNPKEIDSADLFNNPGEKIVILENLRF